MNTNSETKYDIALSFAGEDRDYVAKVAILLKEKGIGVFYDHFDEVNLWGKDLYVYLSDIYKNQAKYTVIFISKFYNEKLWTNHERQSMQARAFEENEEYILPVRFDDTDVKGILKTTGYLDLRTKTPEELADIIEKKLVQSGSTIPSQLLRRSYSIVSTYKKIAGAPIIITVRNQEGGLVENATIYCSADNGTFLKGRTNGEGCWIFQVPIRKLYTILVAHPDYASALHSDLDPNDNLEIILHKSEGIGSIIIESTGFIPGLQGRLNPILDSNNRTYLYADNIAIDGGQNQPVNFQIGQPFELEDAQGTLIHASIKYIKGHSLALIDYTKTE
jgi:hypothetical protein